MPARVSVAAISDVGCVRSNNEDSFGYDPALGLFLVCDGMGGRAAGEVASALACSTCLEAFARQPAHFALEQRLAEAIQAAHDAVRAAAQRPGLQGMGTTLVAAAVHGPRLLVANVGDSRAFLLKDHACVQLTVDHSYVNEMVRSGAMKPGDMGAAEMQRMASVITRALGAPREVQPDFFSVQLSDGDAVLLASDGLTRYLDAKALADAVRFGGPDGLQTSCERLVAAAKAGGGSDNITCILLQYHALAS